MSAPSLAEPWQHHLEHQDGVIARQQALTGGMSADQWQWRLRSERWQLVLPGVAVAHTGAVTPRQRAWAAVRYAGRGAALAGDAALDELGLHLPTSLARVDVAVPDRRTVVAQAFTRRPDHDARTDDSLGRVRPAALGDPAGGVRPPCAGAADHADRPGGAARGSVGAERPRGGVEGRRDGPAAARPAA